MHRTSPKKVLPNPSPNTTENVVHLGWSSSLSLSSHNGSNSMDNNNSRGGGVCLSIMKMKMTFKRSFLGYPKKEKNFPIKNNSPSLDPAPPSQNLGIYLKISPYTTFEINMITLIWVAVFKFLKSMFSLNINHDGSLLIALQDSKSADILLNLQILHNIPIKSALWTPNHYSTKIVVYNIPSEMPIQEL